MPETTTSSRTERIRRMLTDAFAPVRLEVIDESHLHVGHPGAASGGGHFRVSIVSQAFAGKSRIERHRAVYGALSDMMPGDIHALSVAAWSADEADQDQE